MEQKQLKLPAVSTRSLLYHWLSDIVSGIYKRNYYTCEMIIQLWNFWFIFTLKISMNLTNCECRNIKAHNGRQIEKMAMTCLNLTFQVSSRKQNQYTCSQCIGDRLYRLLETIDCRSLILVSVLSPRGQPISKSE